MLLNSLLLIKLCKYMHYNPGLFDTLVVFFFFFFSLLQNTFLSFPEHLSGGYWRIFHKASKQNAINMKLETVWTKCFNNGRLQVRSNLPPRIFCLLTLTHLDKTQFMIKPTGRMLGLCELKQTFCC